MNCEDVRKLLDEYITGELHKADAEIVREHISTCANCRREYDDLKRFKTELKELAEDVPEGFEDGLKTKIKGTKRLAFFGRHSGAGIAAAVVLVCLVGLGYGYGHNHYLEDKMQSVKNSNADLAAAEDFEEKTTLYIEENNAGAEMAPQSAEATTEATTEANDSAEAETEPPTEENPKASDEEAEPESEAEEMPEASDDTTEAQGVATASDEGAVPEATGGMAENPDNPMGTEEEMAENDDAVMASGTLSAESADYDMDLAPHSAEGDGASAPMDKATLKSAVATEAAVEEATLNIKRENAQSVRTALESTGAASVSQVSANEMTVYVSGLSYGELKGRLSEWEPEENGSVPDENCKDFSLVISWE